MNEAHLTVYEAFVDNLRQLLEALTHFPPLGMQLRSAPASGLVVQSRCLFNHDERIGVAEV